MKLFRIVSLFLISILLLAACTSQPAVSITSIPSAAVQTEITASLPSATTAAELYSGPYYDGRLPMIEPDLNDADWVEFNPDKVVDYLIAGALISYGNEFCIEDAKFIDGKLYLTVTALVCVRDVDSAYQYFQNKFLLSETEFTSLPDFTDCSLHNGEMYTAEAWAYTNDTAAYNENTETQASSYHDLNYVLFDNILLPDPVPVADDALITLFDEEKMISYSTATEQFGKSLISNIENNLPPMIDYVLIKYFDGQIVEIEEEYWD